MANECSIQATNFFSHYSQMECSPYQSCLDSERLVTPSSSCHSIFTGMPNSDLLEENCYFCYIENFCTGVSEGTSEMNGAPDFLKIYGRKICFVESMLLITLGFYLFLKERYQKHPYKLISSTILVEAALYFATATNPDVLHCLDLSNLLSLTVIGKRIDSSKERLWYANLIKELWRLQVLGLEIASVLFNAALFLDLYLTLRNPFLSPSNREKYYVSTIIPLAILSMVITKFLKKEDLT